ncbi:MAG: hypothetical protein J6Y69_07105 [Treponema sp.]|nr:hypothetical protein [Treponema sp.]
MKKNSILAALFFPLLLVSCGNTNISEPEPQEVDADVQTLESAKSILTVKTIIAKNESSISLPSSVAGYEGITVSWVSGNESIISINGTVNHQSGTGSDAVNLTATLSLNGKTAIKEFTIKVYQNNSELSTEDVLEVATTNLEANASELYAQYCNAGILTPYTINLDDSVTIDGKNVSVSWSSESDDDHFSLSGNNLTIERDIVDIPVSLKGTLNYDGETVEKTITFTIPRISEFVSTRSNSYGDNLTTNIETYSFDSNVLVITANYTSIENGETVVEDESGEMYSYTANPLNKTITLTKVKVLQEGTNGTWYTKSEYRDFLYQYVLAHGNTIKKVDENPTLANFAEYMGGCPENYALEHLEHEGYYSGEGSVEDAISAYICEEIEEMRSDLNLSNTATHSQIIDAFVSHETEEELEENFPGTIVYDYQIDFNDHGDSNKSWESNISFSAKAAFLAGKHWNEQNGEWQISDGAIHADLWCYYLSKENRGGFYFGNISGKAKFSEDFTSFTLTPNLRGTIEEDDRHWSITEDLPNMKITVSNGHGKTCDLYFDPLKLH